MSKTGSYIKVILSFFLALNISCYASQRDSLFQALKYQVAKDTNRVVLLGKVGLDFQKSREYEKAINYFNQSAELAKNLYFYVGEGLAYKRIGTIYFNMDEHERARIYYNKALLLFNKAHALHHIALTFNALGNLEESAGNYNQSLKLFFRYLNYAEKINSLIDMAIAYNNIAIIYSDMNDYKKELTYNFKALKIREKLNNLAELSASYNNIGVSYQDLDNYESAIMYYKKALQIREKLRDTVGVAAVFHNLAICYKHKGDYKLAEKYYLQALATQCKLNAKSDITLTSINLGKFYFDRRNYNKCFAFLSQALKLSTELGLLSYRTDVHLALYEAYDGVKRPAEALIHYRKYIELRDSLNNVEQSKEFTRIEMQNKFDKETTIRQSEQAKKDAILQQQQKQQKIITLSVSLLLLIITVFLFFVYRSYKEKKKANIIITTQKQEVESQKHLLEDKQKEIFDSINYAKRIQYTLLAHDSILQNNLKEHFVLFKPKDIVSGDFYWATEHADKFYLAVCDSTGHGVPGAFMSLLNMGFLNEAIKEKNISKPNEVLNYVRQRLIDSISKEEQQDGMDAILVCFDKTSKSISYAAANNEPILISNNNLVIEIIELPKDKMPVGKGEKVQSFSLFEINANSGDTLYLYTDGYADQFGGPKGKKFKYKQLNDLLLSNSSLSLNSQSEILAKDFNYWKGDLEQVDDVCVIGIKL